MHAEHRELVRYGESLDFSNNMAEISRLKLPISQRHKNEDEKLTTSLRAKVPAYLI